MKINVGSKNAAKISAVQMAVNSYWPEAIIEGFDVESGVPAQPIGIEQTMQGAINRAKAAHALRADLGIGLEGGVALFAGHWIMFSFVAVSDGTKHYAVPVTGTPLPQAWGEALSHGAELRPHVIAAGLPYDYKTGVIGTLTNQTINRDEMFCFGVKTALVPWVNPAPYQTAAKVA